MNIFACTLDNYDNHDSVISLQIIIENFSATNNFSITVFAINLRSDEFRAINFPMNNFTHFQFSRRQISRDEFCSINFPRDDLFTTISILREQFRATNFPTNYFFRNQFCTINFRGATRGTKLFATFFLYQRNSHFTSLDSKRRTLTVRIHLKEQELACFKPQQNDLDENNTNEDNSNL